MTEVRDPSGSSHGRLANARRRAAERDRTRAELETSMARSRVLLRVERALRQLLVAHETLEAAALVSEPRSTRKAWALSGIALYVGDFARLDVSRIPLDRIVDVAIGVDGPPHSVSVTVAGEPQRVIEDSFDGGNLELAQRLVTRKQGLPAPRATSSAPAAQPKRPVT